MQDLQPSLASAVKSVNRWHLIQSSVPYILQCCSKLLSNRCRLGNIERLGNAERELLYTLHWILLEGPRICCVVDTESLLYPQTIIEQFVHVLIPHVYSMRESDLTFRLENGVAIWGPLWKHEKPLVTPFIAEVIKRDTESEEDDRVNQPAVESDSEFSASTFFDVAVLKCLLSTGWAEDGIVWALRYLAEYLKREFNLPEEVISKEPSGEIQVNIPAHGSPVRSFSTGTRPVDSAVDSLVKNSTSGKEYTEPDGGVIKIAEEKRENQIPVSEDTKDTVNSSMCTCQIDDDNSNNVAKDEETSDHKSVENLATVPQSLEDKGDKKTEKDEDLKKNLPSNDQDALQILPSSDEGKLEAPGLDRTGSIRLRIRVQSSPVLSQGGRVLAAVASPSGSPAQNEVKNTSDEGNSQELSDTGTFHNPKAYIKPSNTLQVPSIGTNDANMQDGSEIGSVKSNVATASDVCSSEANIVSVDALAEGAATVVGDSGQANAGPAQTSCRHSSSSSGALESIVSCECEEGSYAGGASADDRLSEVPPYKPLSERPSSSQASSSSVESESQPLLNPSKAAQTKPTSILESFDTSQSSINRDSFMRMERYFVFPGAADYITTDGRLSIMMILQALNSILRENPTSRICDATLTVLRHLVTIHENNKSKKRGSSLQYDDRTVAETQAVGFRSPHTENVLGRLRASFYGRPPSFLSLTMGCLVSLIKALGCPLGKVLTNFIL